MSGKDEWMSSVLGVNVAAHRTSMRLPDDKKTKARPLAKASVGASKTAKPAVAPADAKPSAPAQINGRAVLEAEMPYGKLKYFADWEKEVKPLLTDVNARFAEAEDADTSLEEAANEMEEAVEKLGPLDAILAEINKHTDRTNKLEAGNAQDAQIMTEHMTNTLERIRSDVKGASENLQITADDQKADSKKRLAASFLKAHEEIQGRLNIFLGLVDEAIGLGTSTMDVGKAAGYATKVFKIAQSLVGSPLVEEAEKLQKEAQEIEIANLAKRYQLARDQLRAAQTHLKKEMVVFKKLADKFLTRWSEAERNYDKATKGKFRFEDLKKAIDRADRTVSFARDAHSKFYAAEKAVKILIRIPANKAGPWMAEPRAGMKMLKEIDEAMNVEPSVRKRQRAESVLKELNRSYDAIREAMAN